MGCLDVKGNISPLIPRLFFLYAEDRRNYLNGNIAMPRNRERHIQKEKDKGIIEMAAEQFANLLWKQLIHNKRINKLRSKSSKSLIIVHKPIEKSN